MIDQAERVTRISPVREFERSAEERRARRRWPDLRNEVEGKFAQEKSPTLRSFPCIPTVSSSLLESRKRSKRYATYAVSRVVCLPTVFLCTAGRYAVSWRWGPQRGLCQGLTIHAVLRQLNVDCKGKHRDRPRERAISSVWVKYLSASWQLGGSSKCLNVLIRKNLEIVVVDRWPCYSPLLQHLFTLLGLVSPATRNLYFTGLIIGYYLI